MKRVVLAGAIIGAFLVGVASSRLRRDYDSLTKISAPIDLSAGVVHDGSPAIDLSAGIVHDHSPVDLSAGVVSRGTTSPKVPLPPPGFQIVSGSDTPSAPPPGVVLDPSVHKQDIFDRVASVTTVSSSSIPNSVSTPKSASDPWSVVSETAAPRSRAPWKIATGILGVALIALTTVWLWLAIRQHWRTVRDLGSVAEKKPTPLGRRLRWLLTITAAVAFAAGWMLHPAPRPRYSAYKYGLLYDRYSGTLCAPTMNGRALTNFTAPPCQ